nr:MAG TPA: hypothetical protein [Caudoviricetes sp.]
MGVLLYESRFLCYVSVIQFCGVVEHPVLPVLCDCNTYVVLKTICSCIDIY